LRCLLQEETHRYAPRHLNFISFLTVDLAKVINGPVWEGRLAKHAVGFTKRRTEFEFALTIHTARGVDAANQTLALMQEGSQMMNAKIDMMMQLFQRFTTPEEKKVALLVEEKGGAAACQANEALLMSLNEVDVKNPRGVQTTSQASRSVAAKTEIHTLMEDLRTDPEEAIQSNMKVFERKFEIQKGQLKEEMERIVRREGDRVISALTAGPHDKLIDPVC